MLTPRDNDWNRFWQHAARPRSQISWSKQRILRVIGPHLAPGKRIVEAGCGSGFFSAHFCDNGLLTTAVDFSQQALDLARIATQGRAQILKADFLKNPLPELIKEKVDLIFTDGLFEHFSSSDQDNIMRNFLSILKQGGKVLTFVPNRYSPWQLIRPLFMPGINERPFVLRGLHNLNKRNALHIETSGGLNVFPWRVSPEGKLAQYFGMILFAVAVKT